MQFKTYKIPIKTGTKYVAVLTPLDALKLDVQPGDRIKVTNPKLTSNTPLTVSVDISDDESIKDGFVGLFSETHKTLQLRGKGIIEICPMEKPKSVQYIKNKLHGKTLTDQEINEIIKDVVKDNLTEVELTYFVSGAFINGFSDKETAALTKAIVNNGQQISFSRGTIVDKHCIGGLPGNRTTMVIVPIVAASGLKMPKTSSRAITSPSGTADTMEVLANVSIPADQLKELTKKYNGFVSWGGGVDIASADDHIIRVRHPLSLDPEGMMLASIMAKKFAVGSKKVLIDIPIGKEAKAPTTKEAKHLKKRFIKIGQLLDMEVTVIFTDGSQPVGNGIGPALEAIDVMQVLENHPDAPLDLREKSLEMAGLLLELGGKAKPKKGYELAQDILNSGKALKQFNKIIKAQGKSKYKLRKGKHKFQVTAPNSGKIIEISNYKISKIARMAGAPIDKYAGVVVLKKLNHTVNKGDVLFEVYADSKSRLEEMQAHMEMPYLIK